MSLIKSALTAAVLAATVMGSSAMVNNAYAGNVQDKIIVAHRGASAYLPEHTLESKALAYNMGVSYVEQDLAMTKDNRLVVVHDHYLDRVTDVADKFPKRARKDGRFYVIDFTLDEIRTLNFTEGFEIENGKRVQGYKDRFPIFKSTFRIHTLEEEIEFVQGLNKTMGKDIGLYVETKAPWFHKQEGKDISKATLEVLKKYGYTSKDSNVIFQTFDYPDLKYVKTELMPKMGMDLKTVMLLGYTDWKETYELKNGKWEVFDFNYLLDPKNFKEVSKYATGLGPTYEMLFDLKKTSKGKIVVNDFVKNAHANGMVVHPYTVRADKLPEYCTDVDQLFKAILIDADADGVFTDFPDLGTAFLQKQGKK
ncbi:glycerophosphodiester phosphodiesterase [Anaerobiospirillum sp. NML120449]|uniref:glycerophosphodiester phosphodiesterase n=1 Tax=Anaerobiospirillum sp. NML120449 TaxID=2932817 RepID=UPI001FF50643|nr:glycerophosphodiester phosphodiesterase [Anaerobiospirillum sp. NML120449]MCK0525319.1 glycerophosphodiester phosphodiesterase [Anaerobiospirillum sp. NML120449]